jgi:parvulin-like peptidyl-prolyl isomerase
MKYLIALISLLVLISCNSNIKNDDVVAAWRGGQITLKEYEDFALYYAFDYESDTAAKSTFDKRREILTDMINFKLIELLADSLQLDTMKVMKESYNRKLGGISYELYLYPDSIRRKAFSDDEIKKVYENIKSEYFVSHILLNADDQNEEQVKSRIDSLYNVISNTPASFRSIAESISDDKGSAASGGDLGWNLTANFVPEFEEQLLKIKIGEISKPFRTQFGWHIAVLKNKRNTVNLGSFEKQKGKIIDFLMKKNKDKFDKAFADFKVFIFRKYGVMINKETVSDFLTRFKDNFKSSKELDTGFSEKDRSEIIASFEDNKITVDDALTYFKGGEADFLQNLSEGNISDYLFITFYKRLTYLSAIDLGYSNKPDVIKLAKEGMIIDHLEYFTDRFIGKDKEKDKWYKELYHNYNLTIYHNILENSFDSIQASDDRK